MLESTERPKWAPLMSPPGKPCGVYGTRFSRLLLLSMMSSIRCPWYSRVTRDIFMRGYGAELVAIITCPRMNTRHCYTQQLNGTAGFPPQPLTSIRPEKRQNN